MASHRGIKYFLNLFLILLIVGGSVFYGWFRARDFLAGPVIEINEPENGSATSTSIIQVRGMAKNISEISLNGRKIFTNKEGIFEELVLLHRGHNIILVNAFDRFGRSTSKTLELTLKR